MRYWHTLSSGILNLEQNVAKIKKQFNLFIPGIEPRQHCTGFPFLQILAKSLFLVFLLLALSRMFTLISYYGFHVIFSDDQ